MRPLRLTLSALSLIHICTYGSRRKEILDSVSATVILEDYLAWRKEHPGEI